MNFKFKEEVNSLFVQPALLKEWALVLLPMYQLGFGRRPREMLIISFKRPMDYNKQHISSIFPNCPLEK